MRTTITNPGTTRGRRVHGTQAITEESGGAAAVGDARFWRQRRKSFLKYNTDENRSLSASWSSMIDTWAFSGASAETERTFRSLATIAAERIAGSRRGQLWETWLDELRRARRRYNERDTTVFYSQRVLDDPEKFGIVPPVVEGVLTTGITDAKTMKELHGIEREEAYAQVVFKDIYGTVKCLFEASANLCLDFEAAAVALRRRKGTEAPAQPEAECGRRIPDSMPASSREERLKEFIAAHVGNTLADIAYSAGVHKPDFYKWRDERLRDDSVMSERIEGVLAGRLPLQKKPRRLRRD